MIRRTLPACLLLLATLLPAGLARADDSRIELIELKGRTAEELIPLLQPVVQPDGALSGTGYKLIVRATPAQQREIRRLLEQLDRAPRRLLISVHMGQLSQQEQQGGDLHIDTRAGDVGVELGAAQDAREPGLAVGRQDAATLRIHGTRSVSDAANRQQVQALEGEPAFIATGSERPYPARIETWRGPHGEQGDAVDIQYRQAASGFYAVATLRGDQVVVRISPRREAFDRHGSGAVAGQHIQTTVSGPLGSWLALGSSGGGEQRRDDGIGRSLSTTTTTAQPMWLKVDPLP